MTSLENIKAAVEASKESGPLLVYATQSLLSKHVDVHRALASERELATTLWRMFNGTV